MLRHERRLHHRLHEGRASSRRARPTCRRCRASARPARRSRSEGFEWVYEHVKRDVWLFSTSGGTDLCTAFVGGCPVLPVYAGELQARCLGRLGGGVGRGRPGRSSGEVGELVITRPMPSMPLYFWNDPGGERYRESYFDDLPGRLAPRRLDQDQRARRRGDLRALGLDDQPPGRPHGHERDLQRGGGRARGAWTAWWWTCPPPTGRTPRCGCSSCMARRRRARRGARGTDPAPHARALLAAARAGPDRGRGRGAAHAVRQEARGAGEEDPDGRRPASGRPAATRSPTRRRSTSSSSSGPARRG